MFYNKDVGFVVETIVGLLFDTEVHLGLNWKVWDCSNTIRTLSVYTFNVRPTLPFEKIYLRRLKSGKEICSYTYIFEIRRFLCFIYLLLSVKKEKRLLSNKISSRTINLHVWHLIVFYTALLTLINSNHSYDIDVEEVVP